MKLLENKWIPVALIGFGLIFSGWNAVSLSKGFSAIEKKEMKADEVGKPLIASVKKPKKLYETKPKTGDKIGTLAIPKLKEEYPIFEGTSNQILKKGAGHYTNSVLPGENNNSVISGHRDTIFRGLRKMKKHDKMVVTTNAGTFLYKIRKIRIVDADDKTVITPKPKATLTVTTCYPFYFIGNAPQRYILVADLISSKTHKKEPRLGSSSR